MTNKRYTMIKRILTLLLTLLVMTVGAFAEDAETARTETDSVIALVNGEALMNSDYEPVRENYLTSYATLGYDIPSQAPRMPRNPAPLCGHSGCGW